MDNALNRQRHAFDSFCFDAAVGELRGPGGSVKLRPQTALALHMLLSRKGEVVSRRELREALWPDQRVVAFEASIAVVIRELRRALGDDSKSPRFIETVPKRGYRFLMEPAESEPLPAAIPQMHPGEEIRQGSSFVTWSGVGALVLVLLLGAFSHFHRGSESALDAAPVTVAVLPFEDLTGSPAHRTLAETVPRELVGWLGGAAPAGIRVVDWIGTEPASAAGLHDQHPPDFVIRGSVRDDQDAVVVTAKLLARGDDAFVWGDHYYRSTNDLGLSAREIAAKIATGVTRSAVPGWRNGLDAATSIPAAAEAFRRGTLALAQVSTDGTLEAVDAFSAATELDPGFSEAYAQLARALTGWPGPAVTPQRVEQAREAARRSIELVPANAVGYRVLGEIGLYYDRDWQLAGNYLEQSIRLAPSDASGHHSYATWLSARGRHAEALREIDLAAALDPGSVIISIDVMFLHFYARDFEGTVDAARRLKQIWPRDEMSHRYIVLARLGSGDFAAAAMEARSRLAELSQMLAIPRPASAVSDAEAIDAYWAASLELQRRTESGEAGDAVVHAMLNVQLGRLDTAMDLLETAVASRQFSYLLPYLGVSPAFDRMCGRPEFERILRRLQESALGSGTELPRCAAAIEQAEQRTTR